MPRVDGKPDGGSMTFVRYGNRTYGFAPNLKCTHQPPAAGSSGHRRDRQLIFGYRSRLCGLLPTHDVSVSLITGNPLATNAASVGGNVREQHQAQP